MHAPLSDRPTGSARAALRRPSTLGQPSKLDLSSPIASLGGMTKPLLPAIDAAGQVRATSFALLLRDRRPIEPADITVATGLPDETVRAAVVTLAEGGWLDQDASRRITGSAGLALVDGPHRLVLGGVTFRTWCAYDALGIPAALAAGAEIETACGVCTAPIRITFERGLPERAGPERLWLADGGADLRSSFCTPTVLLCGEEHAGAWARTQGGKGQLMDLVAGARAGAADWAGCAAAAARLA